jgi:cytochrome c oxidase subunit 3
MENRLIKRREPFQFMLWLGILSSAILFLFVLLVFIRKELENQEIPIRLPRIFWLSTLLILGSSYTLQRANYYLGKQEFVHYRNMLLFTNILGLCFLSSQLWGWMFLFEQNIFPSNSTGGAFIFVLSGLHLVHTLGGLVALAVLFSRSMQHKTFVDSFLDSVNPPSLLKLQLTSIYWHFVDGVWVVIFLFFLWQASGP